MAFALFLTHPLDYLANNGIGQNLTAGVIVFVFGWLWSKTKFWPLHAIHKKLDHLHESHEELHAKIDSLHESHRELHKKLDALKDK